MTSNELADAVEEIIRATRERILTVGNEQYSNGDTQKFEGMDLDEIVTWAVEELDDLIVYSAMIRLRLTRLRTLITNGGGMS